jgi:hypothetical protein
MYKSLNIILFLLITSSALAVTTDRYVLQCKDSVSGKAPDYRNDRFYFLVVDQNRAVFHYQKEINPYKLDGLVTTTDTKQTFLFTPNKVLRKRLNLGKTTRMEVMLDRFTGKTIRKLYKGKKLIQRLKGKCNLSNFIH